MLAYLIASERKEAQDIEANRARDMFLAIHPNSMDAYDRWASGESDELLSEEELDEHDGAVFSEAQIEEMLAVMGQQGYAAFE